MNGLEPITLITGATGGIGAACVAALGDRRLFLTDVDAERCARVAEGRNIAGILSGDLSEAGEAARLVSAARAVGPLGGVVHCAGISPAFGDAAAVMRLNTRGTEALLTALETALEPGLVAVVVASIAGHFAQPDAAIDALCATPADDDFIDAVVPLLEGKASDQFKLAAAANAYNYSKRSNILSVQRRSAAWGAKGARIVSISPGLVDTVMGRREVEVDPGAAHMLAMTPLGWLPPSAIADTAAFLLSPAAAGVSGCDIKVDNGLLGAFFQGRSTSGACMA